MASDTAKSRLIFLHDVERMTWRKIAEMDEFQGIVAGTLCSIAKGYEPKDPEIRRKLGFPEVIQQEVHRDKKGQFKTGG